MTAEQREKVIKFATQLACHAAIETAEDQVEHFNKTYKTISQFAEENGAGFGDGLFEAAVDMTCAAKPFTSGKEQIDHLRKVYQGFTPDAAKPRPKFEVVAY